MSVPRTASSRAPRFLSTRDDGSDSRERGVRFETALLQGLAPDGGLYLPDSVPALPDDWRAARSLAELGAIVLGAWLRDELPEPVLRDVARDALDIHVPLVAIGDDRYVLELFHGPTLSFKDFGARTMARLMNAFLERSGGRLTILVATSGDTGSAVADGFASQERVDVVLLYPKGKVSDVQERQLIARRPGVRAFAVDGTFDDCQRLVKAAFVDPALAKLRLSSANSINIGRLLPQSLYYLWAQILLEREHHESRPPLVCVPSGNLGNLTAGLLAARMGMPTSGFLAAHNANDYYPRYLRGEAEAFAFGATRSTLSNAMDVGSPSNFERLHALEASAPVHARSVTDGATTEAMRREYGSSGYVACPHTAVGLEALREYRQATGDRAPALCLATAHPAKFPATVEAALGVTAPTHPRLDALLSLPTDVRPLEADAVALREALLDPDAGRTA